MRENNGKIALEDSKFENLAFILSVVTSHAQNSKSKNETHVYLAI